MEQWTPERSNTAAMAVMPAETAVKARPMVSATPAWSDGYVADIGYVNTFHPSMSPAALTLT
ncbi:hypothetical protein ABTN51_20275, partial [Acinetobacter baumannii]